MRLLFTFLLFLQSITLFGQDTVSNKLDDLQLIKQFIAELANENKRADVVLSQYVQVNNPGEELYDYLEASLEEIRINLMTKNIEDIQYIPYAQMPRKEIKDIDLEGLNSDNIYFLKYRGRHLLALYVEKDKIASFTLVSKGYNKAHFVLY
ncbi:MULTISPECIES: hypothetical protein [Sphingobacterium]|uniref:DUF4252 domain-containing protein n=1 Tax=Sphingobacterium thermophilum TaxID=768534 RepID=A0ABP8R2J1_9SPHI|nr:hypothetical protein [Sphingobacterium sp. T2]